MAAPRFIALAAMAENRVIGCQGRLPWHLAEDLKFFKRTTMDGSVLFGRTTYEGLGRPLPHRKNYVLSRSWQGCPGVTRLESLQEALLLQEEKIFICGGAEIYRQFFPLCEELLLTRVQGEYEGDTVLPDFESWFVFSELIQAGKNYRIERHLKFSGTGIRT